MNKQYLFFICLSALITVGISACHRSTPLANASQDTGSLVDSISYKLTGPSKHRFAKERQAYQAWRSWQDTIGLELIGDIWELWYGGSALGPWQELYLNDVEIRNNNDLRLLQQILSGKKTTIGVMKQASIEMVQVETRNILAEVDNRFDSWREAGTGKIVVPDYYDFGLEIKPRMTGIMDRDMELLRKWVNARNRFSQSLSPDQRLLYDKLTNEQLYRVLWQYQTRFIRCELPRSQADH